MNSRHHAIFRVSFMTSLQSTTLGIRGVFMRNLGHESLATRSGSDNILCVDRRVQTVVFSLGKIRIAQTTSCDSHGKSCVRMELNTFQPLVDDPALRLHPVFDMLAALNVSVVAPSFKATALHMSGYTSSPRFYVRGADDPNRYGWWMMQRTGSVDMDI